MIVGHLVDIFLAPADLCHASFGALLSFHQLLHLVHGELIALGLREGRLLHDVRLDGSIVQPEDEDVLHPLVHVAGLAGRNIEVAVLGLTLQSAQPLLGSLSSSLLHLHEVQPVDQVTRSLDRDVLQLRQQLCLRRGVCHAVVDQVALERVAAALPQLHGDALLGVVVWDQSCVPVAFPLHLEELKVFWGHLGLEFGPVPSRRSRP